MNRSKRTVLTMVALLCAAAANFGDTLADDAGLLDVANLRIRDPFVVTDTRWQWPAPSMEHVKGPWTRILSRFTKVAATA